MKMGAYSSEQEYIDTRMEKFNNKKPGKGDEWLEEWKEMKQDAENKFTEVLNDMLYKKKEINVSQLDIGADYTFLFTPVNLDIGWSYDLIVAWSGTMDYNISLCKSDDLQNPLGMIEKKISFMARLEPRRE